jgi:hypothetical protein
MDLMDQSAQRSLATPEIQQGIVSKQARTLGELELVSAKVDTRYSLAAKIFGWSEAEFWQRWYTGYKTHFKDKIDKKMVRIAGIWGPEVRPFKRDDLVGMADPDIIIESKIVSEAKRIKERNAFTQFYGIIVNNPDSNRRYADKELARLNGMKTQQIKMLFPMTLDEIEAEMENELIEDGKQARVEAMQDHQNHIIIHMRLNESKIRDKHIEMHKKAMYLLRKYQSMIGQMQPQQAIAMPQQAQTNPEKTPPEAGGGAKTNTPTTFNATV